MRELGPELAKPLVADFLKRFKALAGRNGENVEIWQRDSYRDTLLHLGVMPGHAREAIMQLDVTQFSQLPEQPDGSDCTDVCVFWDGSFGQELYVKLGIDSKRQKSVCLSFHIAKFKMPHPLEKTEHQED